MTRAATASRPRDPIPVDAIDVGYLDLPGAANAYLLRSEGGPVLVECGPQACLPVLEQGLRERGVDPARIAHLFLTHIHLDHAGAAGAFARRGTMIHVHPVGAPHLVDPTKLIAGSRRVHGAAYDRFYGDPLPAPTDRVHAASSGAQAHLGDLVFEAIETPGHARHHLAWLVWRSNALPDAVLFTGDAAATLVPGSRFVGIPVPPPEYDLSAWRRSLDAMRAAAPSRLVLTHGGEIDEPEAHLSIVQRRLLDEDAFLRAAIAATGDDEEVLRAYRPWLHAQADAAGVLAEARERFIGDGWMRMNIAGVRRAESLRRAAVGESG